MMMGNHRMYIRNATNRQVVCLHTPKRIPTFMVIALLSLGNNVFVDSLPSSPWAQFCLGLQVVISECNRAPQRRCIVHDLHRGIFRRHQVQQIVLGHGHQSPRT